MKKVMAVDDEMALLDMYSSFLRKHICDTFTDSEDALEKFEEDVNYYDLIILDINMPKLNGVDFCKKIREVNKNVQIILASGINKDMLKEYNVSDLNVLFLEKPFDIKKVRALLE